MNPAIIALDVRSRAEARILVNTLGNSAEFYKIGLELYAAAGMDLVRELAGEGKRIFLDLKLYDIGETVKRAVEAIAMTPVTFLTVHGSRAVMAAAAAGRAGSNLKLLGVTVLTSFDESDLKQMGYECSVSELVKLRAENAIAAGVDGLVCSPLEVARLRELAGGAILVTPGVRSRGAAQGDQKRVATPAEAIRDGADYLVIGRQVTRAEDPKVELERILDEVRLSQGAKSSP